VDGSEEQKARVKELALRLYETRTTNEDGKVTAMDYMLAIVALDYAEGLVPWEYGAIFSEHGRDSGAFPVTWFDSVEDAQKDLLWYKERKGFPDREWRLVKRYSQSGYKELNGQEKEKLNDQDD